MRATTAASPAASLGIRADGVAKTSGRRHAFTFVPLHRVSAGGASMHVPSFIAPSEAPGPTLPWLDAPSVGCHFCWAAGQTSANMHAEAAMNFLIEVPRGLLHPGKTSDRYLRFRLPIAGR